MTSLFGFFAPAGTPPAIIKRFNAEINQVLQEATIQERVRKAENLVMSSSPEEFGLLIQNEFAANAKIVKEANIKAE